jgi:hypothetical protein
VAELFRGGGGGIEDEGSGSGDRDSDEPSLGELLFRFNWVMEFRFRLIEARATGEYGALLTLRWKSGMPSAGRRCEEVEFERATMDWERRGSFVTD